MRTWIGNALVDADDALVAADDHGLVVGDGVFETVKVAADGRPFALTRHLDRLHASAAALGLPMPSYDALRAAIADVLAANAGELAGRPARLRITVTGGRSPLGSERGDGPPTLVVAMSALAAWPESCTVAVVPWTRNARGPLAGVKSTSYAGNVRALAWAHAHGADEAIFANTDGDLCEGTGSNVFLAVGGRLVTPPLSSGCLAGVTRALVLEWTDAEEERVPISALAEADEAFLTSTTRDVLPIRAVDGRALPTGPGPLTRAAAAAFAERAAQDAEP